MTYVPQPHEIEMPTGHYVDVGLPFRADIRVEDIAHKLAQTNRFGGAGYYPYSVAQHAVFVARRISIRFNPSITLAALHHDAAEYITGDTQKPIKLLFGADRARELEDEWQIAIEIALDVEPSAEWKTEIKGADTFAVLIEAKNLLPSKGKGWRDAEAQKQWRLQGHDLPDRLRNPTYWRGELHWTAARDAYLDMHRNLKEALNGHN